MHVPSSITDFTLEWILLRFTDCWCLIVDIRWDRVSIIVQIRYVHVYFLSFINWNSSSVTLISILEPNTKWRVSDRFLKRLEQIDTYALSKLNTVYHSRVMRNFEFKLIEETLNRRLHIAVYHEIKCGSEYKWSD